MNTIQPLTITTPKLLSASKAAEVVGVCRSKFYDLCRIGKGPMARSLNGRRMFSTADLQTWIDTLPVIDHLNGSQTPTDGSVQ